MKIKICMLFTLMCMLCGCQICDTGITAQTSHNAQPQIQETVSPENMEYMCVAGEISIMHVNSTDATLVLPAYIEGQPVTRIGESACYQNTTCQTMILPETLKHIDDGAFYRCYALQEIRIPQNVSTIGSNPFFRCSSLQNIWVDGENEYFRDINGVLFTKDGKIMLAYPEGRETIQYALPDGATAIAADAFGYHTSLQYIIIPDSVTQFPEGNLFAFPEDIIIIASADSTAAAYAAKHCIACSDTLPKQ